MDKAIQTEIVSMEDKEKSENNDINNRGHSRLRKESVIISGRINEMIKDELVTNLKTLNLSTVGSAKMLKKRLRGHYRDKRLPLSSLNSSSELLPFYVVMDFEATCNEKNPPGFRHEIIEFPAVLVDSTKRIIVDEFHEYVKPKLNKKLTKFCSQLTAITQETVDKARDFADVLISFEKWLKKHNLKSTDQFAIVTDGPTDMTKFLRIQCKVSEIPFPKYARKWVNIKKTYNSFYGAIPATLPVMLKELGLNFKGHLHSGLHDSRNIATLLITMINDGAKVWLNDSIGQNMSRHKNVAKRSAQKSENTDCDKFENE